MVMIRLVISSSGGVVMFCRNGSFGVWIMCMISVWVSRLIMNQLDWNRFWLVGVCVLNMYYISVKQVRLKIELIGLKNIMKWLMFVGFYFSGFCISFLFMLLNGMVICEMLYSRFCISSCSGSMGRNGRKVEVISIENILLKLELVVMWMYFSMLLNVCWFWMMFFFRIIRFFFSRMMLVVFLVMFIVLFMLMLILVVCSVGVLLMLLFRKLIILFCVCNLCIRCFLCSGVSWVNM